MLYFIMICNFRECFYVTKNIYEKKIRPSRSSIVALFDKNISFREEKIHTRMFAHNVGPTSEKSIKTNDIKHER